MAALFLRTSPKYPSLDKLRLMLTRRRLSLRTIRRQRVTVAPPLPQISAQNLLRDPFFPPKQPIE